MAAFTATAIVGGAAATASPLFFGSYMVVFLFSGAGNGSTYRMIPSIFAALGPAHAAASRSSTSAASAAVIGIAGAIGAFGGFLIQVAFRQASLPVVERDGEGREDDRGASRARRREGAHRGRSRDLVGPGAVGASSSRTCCSAGVTWFCVRAQLAADRARSRASRREAV